MGRFDNSSLRVGWKYDILPKALFCLNAKTTLNKWKATVKKKKKKKCSLTQLQLVGIKEEKMERGKSSNTSGHDLKPSP